MKIFILCSGESVADKKGIYNDFESPLTKIGKEQAKQTAKFLLNFKFNKIITSPYVCTIETAQIINKSLKLNIETNDLIKGRDEGLLNKLTYIEMLRIPVIGKKILKTFKPYNIITKINNPDKVKKNHEKYENILHIEKKTDVIKRLKKFIKIISKQKDNILIITHSEIIHILVDMLFKINTFNIYVNRLIYCSLTIIDIDNMELEYFIYNEHLN